MSVALEILGLHRSSDWLTPAHRSFRPPSWPPPRDWVVSEDRMGNVLSRWGDSIWNISPWAGCSMILDFGDDGSVRKAKPLDQANADLLRILTTWRMWGIKACATANSLKATFLAIRRIVAHCSEHGIKASDLMRFPRVFSKMVNVIPASEYPKTILELHRLWDARNFLGFAIADMDGIKRLAAVNPSHEIEQTAYIPPRIWTYQVQRLRACLENFLASKEAVESCFNFCLEAYAHNYGSLEAALTGSSRHRLPFWMPPPGKRGVKSGCRYHGRFGLTAERFGISSLIEKWIVVPKSGLEIRHFSAYLSLVQYAGLAYIANFTLQRVSEVVSLRSDCLTWEIDDKLGRVPIIAGETTKTNPDSDARWPTSPSVELAVQAMATVARLRMQCATADPAVRLADADRKNPYLLGCVFEPWSGNVTKPYSMRIHSGSYKSICRRYRRLFDIDQLRITDQDLRLARMLTPSLSAGKGYVVGCVWPLAWHQLRRTGAVNMFSSGLLSDSSLQYLMKHASRLMPLYYGRGYTKLQLNEEVEGVVIDAMYEAMARNLQVAVGDRFVSPLGSGRKQVILVNLVGDKDAKALARAGRRGQVYFREMRVGACTNRGACSYGGVESISRCTGGDGGEPCADALYDREKACAAERDITRIEQELSTTPTESPRYRALSAERKGLENFLNVVRRK